ncbi:MAG: sigma-70 family RNA polymerase sigma factor [Cyanobacteriota bacterium]|nr:sigma-70 family RNA polymerase sigma factor [Cyanobacteriota bacterium]
MTHPDLSDESALIVKIAQRDQGALSDLYDRYARILLGVAYRIVGSLEEAEEVVIDVFSQVWRTAERYDATRARVDGWLFMMTRSRALDRLRSLQRSARSVQVSEQVAQIEVRFAENPHDHLLLEERRSQVLMALEQIPAEQRQVIDLVYFKGLTQAEIAEQTGVPLGTVKTRLRLGLVKLKQALQQVGWPELS